MDYGHRIKLRRKEIGISVDELADRIGKSRATVYRYENGEIEDMPIGIIQPLAKALQTTPAYLMGWDNDSSDKQQKHIETVAAHLAGKDITPKKLKLIEQYIDALFEEDEGDK